MRLKSSKIFVKCAADYSEVGWNIGIWSNPPSYITKATIASSKLKYNFKYNNL